MITAEELKTTFDRAVGAAYNQGKVDALDEIYAPEFVYHRRPLPDIAGSKAYRQTILDVFRSFTDVKLTFDEVIVEGDTIATRWTWQGKHAAQSPFLPIPCAGKQVKISGSSVSHLKGCKVTGEWNHVDWLGFFQQLGEVPPLG